MSPVNNATNTQRTNTGNNKPNEDADAQPLSQPEAPKAATFDGTSSASRRAPFSPPPSPKLTDERQARTPEELEKIRDYNEGLIKSYGKQYEAYLERYAQAVDMAPTKDRIRAFGEPVRYEPGTLSLPVSQRAYYDAMITKPHLEHAIVAHDAIGRALERFDGVRPALDAQLQFEAGMRIFAVGAKGGYDGTKAAGQKWSGEASVAYDADKARSIANKMEAGDFKGTTNAGGSISVDKDGNLIGTAKLGNKAGGAEATFDKEGLQAASGKIGGVTVKLERDGSHEVAVEGDVVSMSMKNGTLTTEVGPSIDGVKIADHEAKAKVAVGTSYDLENAQVGTYGKANLEVEGLLEASVQAGVNLQLVSAQHAKRMIEGKSIFDDVQLNRVGGR